MIPMPLTSEPMKTMITLPLEAADDMEINDVRSITLSLKLKRKTESEGHSCADFELLEVEPEEAD